MKSSTRFKLARKVDKVLRFLFSPFIKENSHQVLDLGLATLGGYISGLQNNILGDGKYIVKGVWFNGVAK